MCAQTVDVYNLLIRKLRSTHSHCSPVDNSERNWHRDVQHSKTWKLDHYEDVMRWCSKFNGWTKAIVNGGLHNADEMSIYRGTFWMEEKYAPGLSIFHSLQLKMCENSQRSKVNIYLVYRWVRPKDFDWDEEETEGMSESKKFLGQFLHQRLKLSTIPIWIFIWLCDMMQSTWIC